MFVHVGKQDQRYLIPKRWIESLVIKKFTLNLIKVGHSHSINEQDLERRKLSEAAYCAAKIHY